MKTIIGIFIVAVVVLGGVPNLVEAKPFIPKNGAGVEATEKNADVIVKTQGMVCSFCAQGLKKAFAKNDAILASSVSLGDKAVYIRFKKAQSMTDKAIKEAVTDAGFIVTDISRR